MLRPHVMETAGVEPAPPRGKRGALPPELHPQEAAQDRLDADMTRGERRGHAVTAVPDDEAVAVAGEPNRRSVAAVLEPLPVELHLWGRSGPGGGARSSERRRGGPTSTLGAGNHARILLSVCWSGEVRTGGVEPPQQEATGLQPGELTDAQRPQGGVADRARTGASGFTLPDAAATPRPPRSGDDRIRTGDLSPDKRVLSRLSYVPAAPRLNSSAGRRKGPLTPS
jgi:hypothetical protein